MDPFSGTQDVERSRNRVENGVLKECEHENGEFISPTFVTPKKMEGACHLILNLKDLNVNEDAEFCHFKIETFADILKLVKSNWYMGSLDIKDAYHSIRVAEEYQKSLKFIWKGKLYTFAYCLLVCHLVQEGLQKLLKWESERLVNTG